MNILIVSRHFSPGHIAHMKAWYKLCEACGYNVRLYLDKKYITFFESETYAFVDDKTELYDFHPDFSIVQNTGFENVDFFKWCRKNKCKILYILHEPYMGLKEILKEGRYFIKQAVACILNVWLCNNSEKVILCSEYAKTNCYKYMKKIARKTVILPLLFLDAYEQNKPVQREFFSMIGTYTQSHGSHVFMKYIKRAYEKNSKQKFQIVTRSNISTITSDPIYQKMQEEGKLIIQQGRPLNEAEMSIAYRRSIATWNGYRRSTQSGVLPNSFMQGTPVIATRLGSFEEFVEPKQTGVFIDNFDYDTITNAVKEIQQAGNMVNNYCRCFFLSHFYYANQIERFKEIISSCTNEDGRQ